MKNIALVVRGKRNLTHTPKNMEQHADVVLSTGMPYGFFGTGDGLSAQMGMSMDGLVANFDIMKQIRPFYVDVDLAQQYDVTSTICFLRVSDDQASKFDEFWTSPNQSIRREMKSFSIVGDNCSTAANMAFQYAGILKGGIPGIDTPDNLYHQLRIRYGGNFSCQSGYVGFQKTGSQYKVVIRK